MVRRSRLPNPKRVGRPVRPARFTLCVAALAAATAIPPPAQAATGTAGAVQALAMPSVDDFYAARGGEPLWLGADGSSGEAAALLVDYLRSAEADGLDPAHYRLGDLEEALRTAWGGSPDRVHAADRLLSETFVAYARDLKRAGPTDIVWVDSSLKPRPPSARQLLEGAAKAESIEAYVRDMGWMHPLYAGLRKAIATGQEGGANSQVLRLNLERARALPAGRQRHIIVNATAARLEMYEDGEIVDSMRVVVGKPKNPTPMMAALVRYTSLNPYWYVPPDLAAERIAPNVLRDGLGYLSKHGYQVMTNWNDDSTVIDPASIDWQAVADGTRQVWIRQLPGPGNSMGQMKFMFPNAQGIYLHDTPQKELLTEASRMFSGGCVRLEDAPRLARWLYGEPLEASSSRAEMRVDLPEPVPVYITYLTVTPSGSDLATYPDVYGRDQQELAMVAPGMVSAAAR